MKERIPLTRKKKFLLLALVPAYFMIAGLFLQPLSTLGSGLFAILREPDFLITDYFVVGGAGAAFLNAGAVTLICLAIVCGLGMDVDGHTITSACLMFGFSLFGKNLINIWSILLGVFFYAKYHKMPVSKYIYVGFYGTSLSPIITELMQMGHLPAPVSLGLAVVTGIAIGFVLPPLSSHVHSAHKGFSLYNVGFAAGIIATVVMSLCKSFGMEIPSRLLWSEEYTWQMAVILGIFLAALVVLSLFPSPKETWEHYRNIWKSDGRGADYLASEGGRAVMLNIGLNGIFATGFVLAVGGELNGPSIGAIFTILGFSATGKHLRNIAPVMAGVWLASLTKTWNIQDPSAILALLLSTTLAPIAGRYGVIWGIIAGFLHSSVVLNVGVIYSGMNLYNNGFAGGLVAMFLVPLIQSIADRRARAKQELSL